MAGDIFGSVVAVSGDTVVAGADFKNNRIGVAYVFARRGLGWEQQAELSAGNGMSGDQFGDAVAVDRDTVVVGAVYNSSAAGAAYVFVHRGVGWEQQAKLTAGDGASWDFFGAGVGVSGHSIVVGAPFNRGTGTVYAFER